MRAFASTLLSAAAAGTALAAGPPTIPFQHHKFALVPPDQALASLHAKASQAPEAVKFLKDVPVPTDLLDKVEQFWEKMQDSFVHEHIPNPAKQSPSSVSSEPAADPTEDSTPTVNKQAAPVAAAAAGTTTQPSCPAPKIRYEWRSVSSANQQAYSQAVYCLLHKPSQLKHAPSKTRLDDYTWVHRQQVDNIHGVGQFLPWHRYFLYLFEQDLRKLCGYTGPLVWWDETKDSGNFNGAPPFSGSGPFGHMPDGNNVCIISGLFNNTQLTLGPGSNNQQHCLTRGVNEQLAAQITSSYNNACLSYTAFNDMNNCYYPGPHAYGHDAIGGDMSDIATSTNDPVFYLHHAFVDRAFRIWQRTDPGPRTYQIGGWTTQPCQNSNGGSGCQPTTLGYVIDTLGLGPQVTIDQVMDTQNSLLCYHYDY